MFNCTCLERVTAEKSQKIETKSIVAVEYIYDTSHFVDPEIVSLGVSIEGNLGEL